MALLVECLGDRTMVESLDDGDVRRFIALRQARGDQRQGRKRGKPVSPRAVADDLHLLKAACRWAVEQCWLRENPIKTKWLPVEQAPRRPMTTRTELDALLSVAPAVHPTARTLLLAVAETGHRISSVLGLRWPDVDLEAQQVRWRADLDKLGFEHQTAISDVLTASLRDWRRFTLAVGDTPVFPSDKTPAQPMSRHFARDLWERLEVAAGMRREAYRGWHSLRRLFANELRAAPLKDLKELGGWKDAQTVVRIYQQATMETMRRALQQRQRFC